ncbi:MAG TPA: response regulator transcription factor [Ktedonobacteraceae bacterium]|nr:response regulator transcription factor [Ktedonobacteraceae bacterium]
MSSLRELCTQNYCSAEPTRLKPELAGSARNVQEYALAYVDRCQGDVPLLEREREILLAALEDSWRQEQYEQVVRLVSGLAYLAGRFDDHQEAVRMLQRGIYACRREQDEHFRHYFQSCLSGLLWAAGDYKRAYRIWWESFAGNGASGYLWEPLRNVVHITDIVGASGVVGDFADLLLGGGGSEHPGSTALFLFMRAFYARMSGDLDTAYDSLSLCLQALAEQEASCYKPFFEVVVRTELARVRGDYACARVYAEAAITLAQASCDLYTVAVLLWDQALFSYLQGKREDLYSLALRLEEVTRHLSAPHVRRWNVFLRRQPDILSIVPAEEARERDRRTWPDEPLSRSEVAVLQLLAEGLSNQEIATGLFIAVGTVKKHIEHIYGKLDVHSRVQAVARARTLGLLE